MCHHVSTSTDEICFIDIQCTSLLVVGWVSVVNQMLVGMVPKCSHWQALLCPEMQSKFTVYSFMNFQEQNNTIYKKLEHCTATNVHIPNEMAIQAAWLHIQLHNLDILVQFPKGNQTLSGLMLRFLLNKSGRAVLKDIFTPKTHS